MPTIADLLDAATARLHEAGVPQPREESLFLLGALLARSRGRLLLAREEAVEPTRAARFERWVERRATREPAQHITGEQEFRGLAIAVSQDVLVPRPETEMLVDALLRTTPRQGTVIDLGTGSGCIPVAAAVARGDLYLRALDRSPEALAVARANAARHGVERRVSFAEGDFHDPPEAWRGCADTVVSNPPYVTEREWAELEPEVRDHDPKAALVPGPTGLEAYRGLVPAARGLLRPGGSLLLELGAGQAEAVRAIVADAGFARIRVEPDLNGIDRMLAATLAG